MAQGRIAITVGEDAHEVWEGRQGMCGVRFVAGYGVPFAVRVVRGRGIPEGTRSGKKY